ncbi:MAG: AraC family transcriptional regulator [Oscillospiraceae bacterium]|nr:AraC family transcriptional regulator [Oscillospiraceae bacterium]MCI9549442.1 AraC family transcriptional regulator [Oscillospiraceae bacterium]
MIRTSCALKTDPGKKELVQYGTGLFPIVCFEEDLAREPVPWHWHPDLEIGTILQGAAVVGAGAERFTVRQGEGFFLNAEVLHALWPQEGEGCLLRSAVFHPRLVGGSVDSVFWQNYIQPLIGDGARQSIHFDGSQPWHAPALEAVRGAWKSCVEEEPGHDLQVREALSRLAFLLSRNRPAGAAVPAKRALRDEERIKRMLRFIEENYAARISVADIAESAAVSQSECLRCFRGTIGASPIRYLKQFRIQKAAQLLSSTGEDVAEIGARCGFEDASYFTKTFREIKGMAPSAYRRERGQGGGGAGCAGPPD